MAAQAPHPARSREARRDLIIGVIVLGAFVVASAAFDPGDASTAWNGASISSQLGRLLLLFAVAGVIGCWFFWRRWHELSQDAIRHHAVETEARLMIERMQDIMESATDRFWETDEQHRYVWRTAPKNRVDRPETHPERNVVGLTRWEVVAIDPQQDENWRRHLADLDAHRPFRHFRFSHQRRGRTLHKITSGKPFFDEKGRFKGYRGTATDITREAESEIAASNAQTEFFSAIESIADGYALWDADDHLIVANEQFAAAEGKVDIELERGMTFADFARLIAASGVIHEAVGREDEWVRETVDHHRHAKVPYTVGCGDRWLEVLEHHLPNGRTLTVTRDITKQRETEQQLQHAQKMEAVGQMTGGIAHDFNNLLQVILGNIETIVDNIPAGSPLESPAKMAQTATERGADLVRRLMAFSRQQTLQPRDVDIHKLVDELGHLLRRVLTEDIEIRVALPDELPLVFLDRTQLETSLLNIAINARDAMTEGGGLLRIEATHEIIEDAEISESVQVAPGDYVILSITDTGSGMTPDVAVRAFEPFFTTKEVGKGTGLGLSMVYGFIQQSGGQVKIHSQVDVGTTIKLYLPVKAKQEAATVKKSDAAANAIPRGSETILLVEDDEFVRDYALTVLEQLGYKVIAAVDGNSALARVRELNCSIDLLFTDIIMPGGMNGRQLAETVTAICPKLKVLYTSGYNRNAIIHAGKLEPGIELLEKPYRKIDLAHKLRDLLDGNRPSA